MDTKCAPSKKYNDGSCFSLEALQEIAQNYNSNIKNKKINYEKLTKKELVTELNNKLSNVCSEQTCWLKLDFVKKIDNDEIHNNTFRPEGPKKKYDWLNTLNINDVIEQYHSLYPDFLFLGAVPYDFEDLPVLGISNIDFDKLEKENKIKIGLVINLDEHYKSGSHWVGLYVDLQKYQIYYIDSVGKKPKTRIKKFITKVFKYMYKKKFNKSINFNNITNSKYTKYLNNFDIRYNNLQHQYENSECGVYSIYFILELLKGNTFDNIITNRVPDEMVNKYRSLFFRNVNFLKKYITINND